jgi:hypothetical protein
VSSSVTVQNLFMICFPQYSVDPLHIIADVHLREVDPWFDCIAKSIQKNGRRNNITHRSTTVLERYLNALAKAMCELHMMLDPIALPRIGNGSRGCLCEHPRNGWEVQYMIQSPRDFVNDFIPLYCLPTPC